MNDDEVDNDNGGKGDNDYDLKLFKARLGLDVQLLLDFISN